MKQADHHSQIHIQTPQDRESTIVPVIDNFSNKTLIKIHHKHIIIACSISTKRGNFIRMRVTARKIIGLNIFFLQYMKF